MWKLYPLILTSPPRGMSEGVMKLPSFLSVFLYLRLSKNLPSMIPEFFCAGSYMEMESSARKNDTMNRRSTSSGTCVLNRAMYLNTVLSLSTYLKKSLLGFSGRRRKT